MGRPKQSKFSKGFKVVADKVVFISGNVLKFTDASFAAAKKA